MTGSSFAGYATPAAHCTTVDGREPHIPSKGGCAITLTANGGNQLRSSSEHTYAYACVGVNLIYPAGGIRLLNAPQRPP